MASIEDIFFGGSEKQAGKQASQELAKGRAALQNILQRTRGDLVGLTQGSRDAISDAVAQSLGIVGQTIPQAGETFQRGNVAAQENIIAAMPQIQNALLGIPVDYSQFQATEIPVDYSWAQQTLPAQRPLGELTSTVPGLPDLGVPEPDPTLPPPQSPLLPPVIPLPPVDTVIPPVPDEPQNPLLPPVLPVDPGQPTIPTDGPLPPVVPVDPAQPGEAPLPEGPITDTPTGPADAFPTEPAGEQLFADYMKAYYEAGLLTPEQRAEYERNAGITPFNDFMRTLYESGGLTPEQRQQYEINAGITGPADVFPTIPDQPPIVVDPPVDTSDQTRFFEGLQSGIEAMQGQTFDTPFGFYTGEELMANRQRDPDSPLNDWFTENFWDLADSAAPAMDIPEMTLPDTGGGLRDPGQEFGDLVGDIGGQLGDALLGGGFTAPDLPAGALPIPAEGQNIFAPTEPASLPGLQLPGLGTMIGSAIAGYGGRELGESLFDRTPTTAWGSTVGSGIGSALLGPGLGTMLGSALGGLVDAAFGTSDKKNVTIGLATTRPGDDIAGEATLPSGLQIWGINRRAGGDATQQYMDVITGVDEFLTNIAAQGGFDVTLSNDGFGGEVQGKGKNLKKNPTFFGSATEGSGESDRAHITRNMTEGVDRFIDSWITAAIDQNQITGDVATQLRNLEGSAEERLRGFAGLMGIDIPAPEPTGNTMPLLANMEIV